jgi:hypothetical protein
MFTRLAAPRGETTAPHRFIFRINESGDSVKRICLLGAAIAGLFIIGATTALASAPHAATKGTNKKTKSAGTKLTCSMDFSLQVPADDNTVTQGATQGDHAGTVACPAKGFGSGAESDSFTTDDAGDLVGKWQEWFNTGSVYGGYTLTPSDNNAPPTAQSFAAASYTGTFTIKSGTGAAAKATGQGTISCTTQDSVHYACKESGRITLPSATTKG